MERFKGEIHHFFMKLMDVLLQPLQARMGTSVPTSLRLLSYSLQRRISASKDLCDPQE